ncbi:SMC-Scp complex subunit ScpB, partial [Xylella fastidiosa subsp. multiplex]|nr:SMC-Scp complex subunit ScpB [Xylella fastidiosa subsp. multiplex]
LDELPPLSDLKDIGELDPQLPLHNNHRHTAQLQIQTDQTPQPPNRSISGTTAPISGISPQPTHEVNTECCSSTQSNRPDNN